MTPLFNVVLIFLGIVAVCWILKKLFGTSSNPAEAEDDPNQAYTVYTNEFDIDASAAEVAQALEAIPPFKHLLSKGIQDRSWPSRILAAERAYESCGAPVLPQWITKSAPDTAVAFLIDLSGSMGNSIVPLAGALKRCCEALTEAGLSTALVGFTTVGWKGGQSRQKWLANGAPVRPGRLCDLLHVTFKSFPDHLNEENWSALLHPALLCENVDGEAIEWASSLLSGRHEPRKILIVLSDGAPVDDSTLQANGPNYLGSHIRKVIADLQRYRTITLGAIGIDFAVDQFFESSVELGGHDSLSDKLQELLEKMNPN